MTTLESRTLSITVNAPYDAAYQFAQAPENFPKWASGLSKTLHKSDHGWIASTPEGEAVVEFSSPNAYGVLDHTVRLPGKPAIYIPLRLVRNGDGVEVSLLLLRQPDMDDAAFARDAATVRKDLETLKRLLEATP